MAHETKAEWTKGVESLFGGVWGSLEVFFEDGFDDGFSYFCG